MPDGTALHLSDANSDLMATYRVIRDAPKSLARQLAGLDINVDTFGRIRDERPSTELERASRFIYLNRVAFSGLWRVNARGEFNVPFGCKSTTTMPTAEQLLKTSYRLADALIESGDFEAATSGTDAAFVYLDPPYTVTHNRNGFIRYNERLFSWRDQERLADAAESLYADGKYVVVSNALHDDVLDLYRAIGFKLYAVERINNLAAQVSARGIAQEMLAVSPNVRFRTLPPTAARKR